MLKLCLTCIGLCFFNSISQAEEAAYKVTYVYDGDTVILISINSSDPQDAFKLRLTDIDAPERNQSYGLKSRRALIKLCKGKNITVTAQISGTDQYQRSLGRIQCNGIDANYYLVEHGLAWFYKKYSHDFAISEAETNAKKLKLGLWSEENPTPPWVWRHEFSQ